MAGRRALLIATDKYADNRLPRLFAPLSDVKRLAAVLRDPDIAGFDVLPTLYNRPSVAVGAAIGKFYRDARRDDLVLLYISGHGLKDLDDHLYLAMTNSKLDNLDFSAVPSRWLRGVMDECRSKRKVLILDCCYAGAFPPGTRRKGEAAVDILAQLRGHGTVVLTSSDAMRSSFEDYDVTEAGQPPSSVFTRFLVAGLKTGQADLDEDGVITLDELYRYVHDRVTELRPEQRPKRIADIEGDIVIARNINWAVPQPSAQPATAPQAEADPLPPPSPVDRAATARHRRRPAALIAAGVPAVALAVAVPLALSASAPPTRHSPGPGSATVNARGTATSPGHGGTSPAASGNGGRTQPAGGSTIAPPAPAVGSTVLVRSGNPVRPSGPTRSSSPTASSNRVRSSGPVSSGSPQEVPIPDVIGLTPAQATRELESDGFSVVVVHSSLQAGTVFQYSPTGQAPPGTTITIWC